MKNNDITFVLQGPVVEDVTELSIKNIRNLFPGSFIILSTWENQKVDHLHVDALLENRDPGPTIMAYDKKGNARTTNVNRQVLSTAQGLKSVTTKYAVKMRTDNYITSRAFVDFFTAFPERNKQYSLFNNRIVSTNFFAKEVEKGRKIPYFFSDFFHFGETEDLVNLWDIPLFPDYIYNPQYKGKIQHRNFPKRLTHVEQELWVSFINKKKKLVVTDELGNAENVEESYNHLLNNIIITDGKQIGLQVPERLQLGYCDFPYYYYTFMRWKWLYEKEFKIGSTTPLSFKLKWYSGYLIRFFHKGLRNWIKSKIYYERL
ncbi:WavE lipopolysaccharide synthesis family protein [Vibrio sp. S4M6]|uniref:WavE lipopolysaccharide synthesis family protein n=1 Tax=Vibrio sinus TaxID=2946865 RepID=UPI00202A7FE8|nr:WavE lipopolysaccharide synthesis family protein [Vibrio sinus]MCL9780357.1 WavE lipopolysaccharide synthesis family protein [Vibrio sinus]